MADIVIARHDQDGEIKHIHAFHGEQQVVVEVGPIKSKIARMDNEVRGLSPYPLTKRLPVVVKMCLGRT